MFSKAGKLQKNLQTSSSSRTDQLTYRAHARAKNNTVQITINRNGILTIYTICISIQFMVFPPFSVSVYEIDGWMKKHCNAV